MTIKYSVPQEQKSLNMVHQSLKSGEIADSSRVNYDYLMPKKAPDHAPTSLGNALQGILDKINSQPEQPDSDHAPGLESGHIWIDVETLRWASALGLSREYLLYRQAQEIAQKNRVNEDELFAASPWAQSYTYRLLRLKAIDHGESPFFRGRNGKWLYLRAEKHMSASLAQMLVQNGLFGVLDGRRPGLRKRQVKIDSSPADLYAVWLSTKGSNPISRETLARLWNVDERTVIRWDKAAHIKKHKHFAQSSDLRDERVPADRADYQVATIDGQTVAMWQRPNAYSLPKDKVIREHPHKGQAKKVRLAVNAVLGMEQHAEKSAASHPFQTKNFIGGGNPIEAQKDYQKALKKRPFARVKDYLYRGRRCWKKGDQRRKPGIWELQEPRPGQDVPRTTPGRFRVVVR